MLNPADKECGEAPEETGGYFGLELPCYPDLYADALEYQSGRAAIRAVLEHASIKRVMVPAYVCDSVIKAVVDAGAEVETYVLNEVLYPQDLPHQLAEHGVLLYVNYFGLCSNNIRRLLNAFPRDHLIIDNSQALFAPHEDVLATVYSPRKFVGVPDGGLLRVASSLRLAPPDEEDRASIERMRSLLVRMAYSAREGYADFQKIALSLKDTAPLRMSRLTQRLMRSLRWDQIAKRRRENFLAVAEKLDTLNDMHWQLGEREVPMCYPLTLRGRDITKIRASLAARDIFVPVYWQDALPRIKPGSIEAALTNETLFLPIDQRLECAQAEEMAGLILHLTGQG